MSNDKRKFYSISQENSQVYSILAELEGQKRNLSDYVCKAIIEKYNRDKNSVSAEDMMRTLLSMMNGNTVQAPMAQPVPVQPIMQPITPAPQPMPIQEIKPEPIVVVKQDTIAVEPSKANKQTSALVDEETQKLAQERGNKMFNTGLDDDDEK